MSYFLSANSVLCLNWLSCVFLINLFLSLTHVAGESGSADTVRDPRGFAVKFYTDEGNWDLTGNNTPIFFIRDAMLVSSDV